MCIATGLVGGEAFSIDASLIKADVDKKKRMPGDQPIAWPKIEEASHAVREALIPQFAKHLQTCMIARSHRATARRFQAIH
jgi:hypothetical protein